ncbi:MAG TPA: trehalose-phosphatase [Caulobacteraceae bacterium]|nr:trehalose-phosphatase [Caulobacteraceae bacterium]
MSVRPAPAPLSLAGTALFLDLDGTLAPISPRPEDVGPEPERTALLRALAQALDGRLAVISGRTLGEVDRILDRSVAAVAGVHGLERRFTDGAVWRAEASPNLAAARRALAPLTDAWPGAWLEDKGLSLAVHYRAAPAAAEEVRHAAEALARAGALVLQAGDMVLELRTPGPDKGDAVGAFMAQAPFAGGLPVFVGDDLTDERGFAAATEMGGFGVLVGSGRKTAALAGLTDVAAVRAWLRASLAAGRAP